MKNNQEIRVYVINADQDDHFRDWLNNENYEAIMNKAEELGTVYSLQGFQDAINDEQLYLDNSWIYISGLK